MNRKAVFFDIDGTLFATKIGIPKSTVDSIASLRKNGHLAFISSGRSRGNIDGKYDELGFDGYVAGGGSYVEIHDKVIKNILLSKEELDYLTDVFNKAKSVIIYEGPESLYYEEKDEDFIKALFEKYPDVWPISRFKVYNPDDKPNINKLCCELYPDSDVDLLNDELGDRYSLIIHAGNEYAELMPKGLVKSVGLKEVIDYFGIDREDSIAIGDSMNDMDMIEFAGCGVAMGNACDELKAIADYCTSSIENNGIAKALEYLGLI